MRGFLLRLTTIASVVSLCLSAGACSSSEPTEDELPSARATAAAGATEGRLAASLKDYITFVYDRAKTDGETGDVQLELLRRSAENGSVSTADYESAWNNFKTCMTDLGYSTPVLRKFPNGMYQLAGENREGATMEQEDKLSEDFAACHGREVTEIDGAYAVQVGNPNLLSDNEAALVDCFHTTGLVPDDYTKDQYLEEREKHRELLKESSEFDVGFSFSLKDPKIRGCFASYGAAYTDATDPDEQIWYPFRT